MQIGQDLDKLALVEPAFLEKDVLERGLNPHSWVVLFVTLYDADCAYNRQIDVLGSQYRVELG